MTYIDPETDLRYGFPPDSMIHPDYPSFKPNAEVQARIDELQAKIDAQEKKHGRATETPTPRDASRCEANHG